MEDQIQKVRKLRNEVKALLAHKSKVEEEFNLLHEELFGELTYAKEQCSEAEQVLRDMTLQAFKTTGNKAPAPGVGIRVITKLLYDAGRAFEWARQHGLALKLDTSAFEKIAKADKPDFVEITEEPTATIATDLSKVLEEA